MTAIVDKICYRDVEYKRAYVGDFFYREASGDNNLIYYETTDASTMKDITVGQTIGNTVVLANENEERGGVIILKEPTTLINNMSVTIMDNYLVSITFPSTVTTIGNNAFKYRQNLENIYLGESIESMGENLFYRTMFGSSYNIYLRTVTPPTIASNTLSSKCSNIYVPSESVEAYKAAENWSNYADKISALPDEE